MSGSISQQKTALEMGQAGAELPFRGIETGGKGDVDFCCD